MSGRSIAVGLIVGLLLLSNVIQYGLSRQQASQHFQLATEQARAVASNIHEASLDLQRIDLSDKRSIQPHLLLVIKKLQSTYEGIYLLQHSSIGVLNPEDSRFANVINSAQSDLLYMVSTEDYTRLEAVQERLSHLAGQIPVDLTPDYLDRFKVSIARLEFP